MDKSIRLALYGDIEYNESKYDFLWDLFQSQPLTRLRDISLSSNPARFSAHSTAASRFKHSVGVAYLAEKLVEWNPSLEDHRELLMSAAICHDIGSPPFSHVAEIFMYDILHRTHEQETEILLAPGSELYKILVVNDINPLDVINIINGEGKLGPLIAGSIDLDNIDNSIRLLHSIGYPANQYDPTKIIQAYCWPEDNKQVHLDTAYLADLIGWIETRRELYAILRTETHLSSTSMLQRAMEFAFEGNHINEDFFQLNESEALYALANLSGSKAAKLINHALTWNHYHLCYEQDNTEEDLRLSSFYDNWRARKEFTDTLADSLRMPREDVVIYVGKNRGEKEIRLPFYGDNATEVKTLFSSKPGVQKLSIFFLKDHIKTLDSKKVSDTVEGMIEDLPEASKGGHSFL